MEKHEDEILELHTIAHCLQAMRNSSYNELLVDHIQHNNINKLILCGVAIGRGSSVLGWGYLDVAFAAGASFARRSHFHTHTTKKIKNKKSGAVSHPGLSLYLHWENNFLPFKYSKSPSLPYASFSKLTFL